MTHYVMAEITLPTNFNDGRSMDTVHFYLRDILCTRHGGYTALEGRGGWKAPSGLVITEQVTLYRVRVADNEFEGSRMIELAQMLADLGRQDVIMISAPTIGTVMVDKEGNLS